MLLKTLAFSQPHCEGTPVYSTVNLIPASAMSSSSGVFPEYPSRESMQDCSWRRWPRNQLGKSRLTIPHLLGHARHWCNKTHFTWATISSPSYCQGPLKPLSAAPEELAQSRPEPFMTMTETLQTYGTQEWGRVLNFDLETQETNDLALCVMNGGVKSHNCLHVLCLILDESDLEHRQNLDIKKRFPVCTCLYRETNTALENYHYWRNCNWAKELSLLQYIASCPNTEMWRSSEFPTLLFDSCFFQMR